MHLKLEKRLSQIVQGRSEQVSNVLTDLPKPLRTLIWSYMSATSNARGGEVGRSAAFSTKCSDGLEILQKCFKNVLQRLEKKVVRNHRGRVKTSPQRPCGLVKASQNRNQVIIGRHGQCRWRGSWPCITTKNRVSLQNNAFCPEVNVEK